jgi:hypothetical protein
MFAYIFDTYLFDIIIGIVDVKYYIIIWTWNDRRGWTW